MRKIPERPNIFELATKELTLDAMVAWFLNGIDCQKKPYKSMAVDFIDTFIFGPNNETLELFSCGLQYYRMDVFAVIRKGDFIHPVIFEDKTNTSLHAGATNSSGQLVKYCKRVYEWVELEKRFADENITEKKNTSRSAVLREITESDTFKGNGYKWGEIYYIYFKIGFIHSLDVSEFESQRDNLLRYKKYAKSFNTPEIKGIKDMLEFLRRHNAAMTNDLLFKDYYNYIKEQNKNIDRWMENWNTTGYSRYESLSTYPGQHKVLEYIFGEAHKSIPGIPYGGREVLEQEIDVGKYLRNVRGRMTERKRIRYIYTFKFLQDRYGDKEYYPVLVFQQYRDDRNVGKVGNDRIKEYRVIYKKTREVIDRLRKKRKYRDFIESEDHVVDYEEEKLDGTSRDGIDIYRIWFWGNSNSSENICDFVKDFNEEFLR
jgi:hypothetical protein